MKISRRTLLKIAGGGCLAITFLPRVAFAAPNKLKSLRTGIQPGNKTRLVIETTLRPSYTISYAQNQLIVNLANANGTVSPQLASGTLINKINQNQSDDRLQIVAQLNKSIGEIPKSNIMVLSPNGDNDYRLVLDFASGTMAAATATTSQITTPKTPAKKYVIVIDAGHGGKDPGAIGANGTQEKKVVLEMAKRLKTKLDASGYKTYLTRSTDTFLNLDTRADIAEKNHADLFLSLHANANPSRTMKGFSIYTLSKKASDEEAQKLAESENAADKISVDGFEKFSADIRSALSALQQQAVAQMSMGYANDCSRTMKSAGIKIQDGPSVRTAPFAVLRSSIPGALVELGHLSNRDEEKLLNSAAHQNKLVAAIVKSINNYDFDV